ncbi:MAG: hypothetical protein PHG69_01285 [Candidatus Omnitrophica bacterium]|nr:hypothetical protein [Candidatus Omnitrophota bacterium]
MKGLSNLQKDFIASHIRSQLATMEHLLINIENTEEPEYGYAIESLKRIEVNLRQLRSFLVN